MRCY